MSYIASDGSRWEGVVPDENHKCIYVWSCLLELWSGNTAVFYG